VFTLNLYTQTDNDELLATQKLMLDAISCLGQAAAIRLILGGILGGSDGVQEM